MHSPALRDEECVIMLRQIRLARVILGFLGSSKQAYYICTKYCCIYEKDCVELLAPPPLLPYTTHKFIYIMMLLLLRGGKFPRSSC